jgi:GTP-binding protein
VLADIPGLIEGAHEGAGIGDRFLGHVERCGALLHLVDAAGEDPETAYGTVRGELQAYGHGLQEKPEILALSRADVASAEQIEAATQDLAELAGRAPRVVSAATGEGVDAVLDDCLVILDRTGEEAEAPDPRWSRT